jgi:GntR family transcriptional regulator / MocR family aminotransferase
VRVDPDRPDTLQRQIYADVRRSILDGTLAAGARLPSSRALAEDLGLSRTTTLLAFDQLLAEGYLTARRGAGTFVAADLPDDFPPASVARLSRAPRRRPPSRRGLLLASAAPTVHRLPSRAAVPFRLGIPALDAFPIALWSRVAHRRVRGASVADLDYGDAAGLPALREAIAAHVRRARGTVCTADHVVVVTGAQRGLDLVFRFLLDPGDEAWMEEPGYPGARNALLAAGARMVPVPVDSDGLDVAAGAARAPSARLAYVTPSHQFPLGVPLSMQRRLGLLKWAAGAGAWVVEDDYDSEFRHAMRPLPCLHGLDPDGRVVYVGSFAKSLFPSLRLAFLLVPSDIRDRLVAARRASDLQPPGLAQAVLADFIGEGHFERHLRRMRSVYRERLEALTEAAAGHCSGALRVHEVRAGLHVVADVLDADAAMVCHEAAAREVEVMPLSAYRFGRGRVPNAIVLGFAAVPPRALRAGMERLARALEVARRARPRLRA